jgi:hypothetical protein
LHTLPNLPSVEWFSRYSAALSSEALQDFSVMMVWQETVFHGLAKTGLVTMQVPRSNAIRTILKLRI